LFFKKDHVELRLTNSNWSCRFGKFIVPTGGSITFAVEQMISALATAPLSHR
jgi:hypothetical protein